MDNFMITPAQCRAARALIDWSREQLSEASRVSLRTVVDFERGARAPREVTLLAIQQALAGKGVTFLEAGGVASGPGVSLHKPNGAAIDVDENEMVQYRENLENDAPPSAGG